MAFSEWPRLTNKQRQLLINLDRSPNGCLCYPINRTYLRLLYEGMVRGETIISEWVSIEPRGRDYVRFVLNGKRTGRVAA